VKPATAKAKGRATENQAVEWLIENGFPYAERRRLAGSEDLGDVSGIPGVTIEIKSAAEWKPVQWLKETRVEQMNNGDEMSFCMARPKATNNVDDWVFIVPSEVLLELLTEAGWRARP
jgi:hypothetical protein